VGGYSNTTNDRGDSGQARRDFHHKFYLELGAGRLELPLRMSDIVPASMAPAELEEFLHAKIPLTAAMGIRVIQTGPRRLILEAPLAPNVNHLGTVFGGALHTLPTLACYAALWTLLVEGGVDGHVVVKQSQARYRSPVRGTFRAACNRPPPEIAAKFIDELRRFRKARMDLESVVDGADGKPAVEFQGSFVAVV
jgi:thioesterase domain-containing protein